MSDSESDIENDINALLPLEVREYTVTSSVFLSLLGHHPAWNLALLAECKASLAGAPAVSSYDDLESLETLGNILTGCRLLSLRVSDDLLNPVFTFSGGTVVEVISDPGEESWTMSVTDLPYVVVG